ncbi:MAG: hypothetical protein GWN58_44150 [Anaerolineae bacterium]|nr:hypothetical protein [Anaerolineae bacterium]
MSRVSLKTAGRLAGLLLMVVAMLGPWFVDTHPATEETCSPPLVWVGEGYCACLITMAAALGQAANLGQSAPLLLVLCLPAVLPFVGTLLLLVGGERRGVWAGHLVAWGLAGAYALIWFAGIWYVHRVIWLWGAGLCVVVATATLVGEVVAARANRREAAGVFQAP